MLNAMVIITNGMMWKERTHQLEQHVTSELHTLSQSLMRLLSRAQQGLYHLHYDIQKTRGELEPIRALLAKQALQDADMLRFAWVDADDHLRVSSTSGIRTDSYSLAGRQYIAQARKHPLVPVISMLLKHRVTGKPIFVVAMGVPRPDGDYLGTLNAVIDLEELQAMIRNRLAGCRCDYRILSPHLEDIVTSHHGTSLTLNHSAIRFSGTSGTDFVVLGHTKAAEQTAINQNFWAMTCLMLGAINAVWLITARLIWRRLVSPLASHLPPPSEVLSHPQPLCNLDTITHHLAHLHEVGQSYSILSQQLKETQHSLHMTRERMSQLKIEQSRMSEATRAELRSGFQAINAYAIHLEDLIAAQLLDPERRYDYDDVTEIGQNLMRLSDGLHLLETLDQEKNDATDGRVDLKQILRQCLVSLMGCAQRRNIVIRISDHGPVIATISHRLLESLITCLVFEAIRCSQDESELVIHLENDPEKKLVFSCRSSHFNPQILPPTQQDFGAFIPSFAQPQQQAFIENLGNLATMIVAQTLVTRLQGELDVYAESETGFYICLRIPNH